MVGVVGKQAQGELAAGPILAVIFTSGGQFRPTIQIQRIERFDQGGLGLPEQLTIGLPRGLIGASRQVGPVLRAAVDEPRPRAGGEGVGDLTAPERRVQEDLPDASAAAPEPEEGGRGADIIDGLGERWSAVQRRR